MAAANLLWALKAQPVASQDVQKAAIVSQQAAAQLDQLVAGTLTAQEFSDATSSDAVQVLSCSCPPLWLRAPTSTCSRMCLQAWVLLYVT